MADITEIPQDEYIGQRIKIRRRSLKLSQTNLANAIGVSYQQLQKYENGSNRISARRLYQISKQLEVSICWFFESDETGEVDAREDELLRLFTGADEKTKKGVLAMLQHCCE